MRTGNLKKIGIFSSLKLRILFRKFLSISLKLNFTPNTLGCCGLRDVWKHLQKLGRTARYIFLRSLSSAKIYDEALISTWSFYHPSDQYLVILSSIWSVSDQCLVRPWSGRSGLFTGIEVRFGVELVSLVVSISSSWRPKVKRRKRKIQALKFAEQRPTKLGRSSFPFMQSRPCRKPP